MTKKNDKTKKTKSYRHERFRIIIQAASFAFHNGYINGWFKGTINSGTSKAFCMPGLNCYSCPGAVGACPIGSLQAVLDSGVMKYSLYVLGFIAAVGVLCGRVVCGWLCPFGAVQDLLYRIPLFKKIKNLPGHKYLRWLKFVILAVFVVLLPMAVTGPAGTGQPWFCEWICPSGTLLGGIPLLIANSSLQSSVGFRFIWKAALLLVILIGAVKMYRPFCKYICPLGAIYGACNKVSLYRLKVDTEKCVQCGACRKACGMDISVWQNPNSIECIRCGKCMAACPTGAISSSLKDLLNKKQTVKTEEAGTPEELCTEEKCMAEDGTPSVSRKSSSGQARFIVPAILVMIAGAAGGIPSLVSGILTALSAPSDNLLNFICYDAYQLALILTGALGIIYGIRLLRHRKDAAAYPELREFARISIIISLAVHLAVVPLMLLITFFVMQGRIDFSYLQNVGMFILQFLPWWPGVPAVMAMSLVLLPKERSAREENNSIEKEKL